VVDQSTSQTTARQRRRRALDEPRVRCTPGALLRDRQHVRAHVDADDEARRADPFEQLGYEEARPAAHVEHAVARLRIQRLVHQRAPAQHVTSLVDPLQLLDDRLVELQLPHRATL
jgi:hypothetical protein